MATYIIQSSDNQQFELSVEQINKYPLLNDIVVEPGSTIDIPFSADLLTIVFNDNYNKPMNLDKLVKVIQFVSYLGLENETNKLLKTLISYFQLKFTAVQVKMIKKIINELNPIVLQSFLSKTMAVDPDYHSSLFLTKDQKDMGHISASVLITSPNLDYSLVKYEGRKIQNYTVWRKNEGSINEISDVPEMGRLNYASGIVYSMYISNDGNYYELVKHENGGTATYDISSPANNNEQIIYTVPIPNYTESNIQDVRMSLDLTRYMVLYPLPRGQQFKQKIFIGSVAEPHTVVSFDISLVYILSPLFNTIISFRGDENYTIHHIENNQVFSKVVNYYRPTIERRQNFYFSYDGEMIAEISGNGVHILNSRGDSLVERDMPQGEVSVAITNEYLITYNGDSYELHFWSIDGLSGAVKPSFAINIIYGKEISPTIVDNVKVMMGENNTLLLTRELIKTTKGITEDKFFEWTKYKFGPYTTMDQFYESLTD